MIICILTYLFTYGAEPFLRSRQLRSPSRTSQNFMEPEGSIPCSQEPSTGPYPEPYQSNPIHSILSYLSKLHFNIVHPPTSWSSSSSFLLACPPISYMHSCSPPFVIHAPPISSFDNFNNLTILKICYISNNCSTVTCVSIQNSIQLSKNKSLVYICLMMDFCKPRHIARYHWNKPVLHT
jgi:hypothetical protein